MKRKILITLLAVAAAAAIIIPLIISGSAPETNISLGGIIPDMTDENRKTEVATFALG